MSIKFTDNSNEVKSALQTAVEKSLNMIGQFVESEAKTTVPVDTGNLKNSLTYNTNDKNKTVEIGSPVEYASAVELGTSRQKAQPYLRPSILENQSTIKQIVEDNLKC